MKHSLWIAAALAIIGAGILLTLGDDTPRRRSGVWELKNFADSSNTAPATVHICVERSSDDFTGWADARQTCSKKEWKRQGDQILTESVCEFQGSVVTAEGIFTGDLERAYRGEIAVQYDPPLRGMTEVRLVQEGRWLEPCPADMKPGDVQLPDGSTRHRERGR